MCLCWMHAGHLGVAWYTNGSLLWDLVQAGHYGTGRTPLKLRLASASLDFRRWAREKKLRHQVPRFTPRRLGVRTENDKGKHPCLVIKAWSSRQVAAWLAEACQAAFLKERTQSSGVRAALAWAHAQVYYLLERYGRHLTLVQRQEAP